MDMIPTSLEFLNSGSRERQRVVIQRSFKDHETLVSYRNWDVLCGCFIANHRVQSTQFDPFGWAPSRCGNLGLISSSGDVWTIVDHHSLTLAAARCHNLN